jgi:hypothetical protein
MCTYLYDFLNKIMQYLCYENKHQYVNIDLQDNDDDNDDDSQTTDIEPSMILNTLYDMNICCYDNNVVDDVTYLSRISEETESDLESDLESDDNVNVIESIYKKCDIDASSVSDTTINNKSDDNMLLSMKTGQSNSEDVWTFI